MNNYGLYGVVVGLVSGRRSDSLHFASGGSRSRARLIARSQETVGAGPSRVKSRSGRWGRPLLLTEISSRARRTDSGRPLDPRHRSLALSLVRALDAGDTVRSSRPSASAARCTTSASSRSSQEILRKRGPLDPDELIEIRKHPGDRGQDARRHPVAAHRDGLRPAPSRALGRLTAIRTGSPARDPVEARIVVGRRRVRRDDLRPALPGRDAP